MESSNQLDWQIKALEQKEVYDLYHDMEFLKTKVLELRKHLDSFTFFNSDPDLPHNPNEFTHSTLRYIRRSWNSWRHIGIFYLW